MDFSEDNLKEIEEMSYASMCLADIATFFGATLEDFRLVINSQEEVKAAINKGRLRAKFDLQMAVTKMAVNGSSHSQSLVAKYIANLEPLNEDDV